MTGAKVMLVGVLVATLGLVGPSGSGEDLRLAAGAQAQTPSQRARPDPAIERVRVAVSAALHHRPIPAFRPPLRHLGQRLSNVGACDYEFNVKRLCRRGDRTSKREIFLLGDSHARHWIPALDRAARRYGYSAYFLVKPGCNAATLPATFAEPVSRCNEFHDWAAKRLARHRPDLLVIAGEVPLRSVRTDGYVVTNNRVLTRLYSQSLIRTVRNVAGSADTVTIIGDVPGLRIAPKECLREPGNDLGDCTFARRLRAVLELQAAKRAAVRTHSHYVNPTKWLCRHNHCPTIVNHLLTYRDNTHLTPQFSRTLGLSLARRLHLVRDR